MASLTCFDVANYFLSLVDEDAGDLVSNLKLQKLVYYAQGFHLALYHRPLFEEGLEAWEHGPVVPDLYHRYKIHGALAIPAPTDVDFSVYDEYVKDLLQEIYTVYGQYSAWKLRELTHTESPWQEAYRNNWTKEISHGSLEAYFSKLINGEAQNTPAG